MTNLQCREHIWRFTKPFKCHTCGEGFGREKTKAIHCDQRKVKCAPTAAIFEYEGSIEQQRDRGVERARNTTEILGHFAEYDRQKSQGVGARDMNFCEYRVMRSDSCEVLG